jgi:hypothetical protein
LAAQGERVIADFDTGASHTVLDFDFLLARRLVQVSPVSQPRSRQHLGRIYTCYVFNLALALESDDGSILMNPFPCFCVLDWANSPMCIVNPNRRALASRVLLFELPCTVELNGQERVSRVFY